MIDVQLEPVYVAPYIQTVSWTRPIESQSFTFLLSGDRYADILSFNTYNGENTDVFEQSLYDVVKNGDSIMPEASDFVANNEYLHEWNDTKLSGNLIQKISSDFYSTLSQKVLGSQNYYMWTVI